MRIKKPVPLLLAIGSLLIFPLPITAQQQPIIIGLPVSLTGNWADLGTSIRRGADLAVEEINRGGGLLGRPVQLDVQDTDESVSPAKLLTVYRFQRSRGIFLFLGPTGTPGGLALAPLASREEVLMISPGVGIRHAFESPKGNTCNIQGGWDNASRLLAEFAFAIGENDLGVLSSRHPFESKQGSEFERSFKEKGGRITGHISPEPETPDILPYISSLLKTSPQAVFISNYNQLSLVARQLRSHGFTGRIFTVQIDESRLENARGALEGAIFSQLSKMSPDFRAHFAARYSEEPRYLSDYAFDAAMILADVIRRTRSLSPSVLAGALRGLKWQGASGGFHFDESCEAVRKPYLFTISAGKFIEIAAG